ncbi:MAG: polyprenyl synthetase family protein [Bacteroidales bacterium]|nr:polyprenyl synthetase family protein [Bacteroidales bacterium]
MEFPKAIKASVEKELKEYETLFVESLRSDNVLLKQVVDHVLSRKGKMMRPIMVLLFAKLYGRVSINTLHTAAALELLHTASLIHDDVVDESMERRSQRSVNALWDNKVAVLTGDFFLSSALMQVGITNNQSIINSISRLGGILAEGELLQLSNLSSDSFDEKVYFDIIERKTASLFATCAECGSYSVEATPEQIRLAREFGKNLGICFQIRDDIFDYVESGKVGKPAGNDMREGKLTLPALLVLNSPDGESYRDLALKIRRLEASAEEIRYFIEIVKQHHGIEMAEEKIKLFAEKALACLSNDGQEELIHSLRLFVSFAIGREY